MEPDSRTTREQRSGMHDDNTSTERQWDNPMSKGSQSKWEHREGELFAHVAIGWPSTAARTIPRPWLNGRRSPGLLLIILSVDNTGGQGGDTYTPQYLGQSGYDEYGTNSVGAGTGPAAGGVDIQSDRYATSGQYGGPTSQTTGYADPTRNVAGRGGRRPDDDGDYGAAVGPGGGDGPTGKPSMTSRVKSTSLPLGAVELRVGAN